MVITVLHDVWYANVAISHFTRQTKDILNCIFIANWITFTNFVLYYINIEIPNKANGIIDELNISFFVFQLFRHWNKTSGNRNKIKNSSFYFYFAYIWLCNATIFCFPLVFFFLFFWWQIYKCVYIIIIQPFYNM